MADDKDLNASDFKDVVSLSEQLVGNLREVAKIERHIQQSIGVSSQEYLFNIKKLEEIVEKHNEINKTININRQLKQQIRSLETTEIKSIQTKVKTQEEYKSSVEDVLSQIRQELRDNKGLLKFAQEQVREKSKEVKFAQELVKNQESEVSKAEKLLQNKSTVTKETQNLISQKYIELQQAQELLKIQESELKQAQQTFSSFKEKVTEKQKEVSVGKELLKEAESEVSKTKEVLKSEKEKIEQLREIKTINQSKIESLEKEKQTLKDTAFTGENQLKTYVDQKKEVQKIQETLNKQAGNIEKAKNLELNRKDINKVVNELTSKKAELESINQKVVERINEIQTQELNTLTEHSIKKEQELDKQREIVEQSKFNLEYALRNTETTKDELDKLQLIKSEAEKKYSVLEKEVSKSNEVVEAKKQELNSLKEIESVTTKIVENIDNENSKLEQVSKHLTRNKNVLDASEKVFNKISKVPLVGQLFNASKAMGHLKDKAKEGAIGVGDIFSAIGKGLSGLSTSTVILAIFEAIYKFVKFIAELMFVVDKQITDIAKSFNTTKESASGIRKEFVEIVDNTDKLAITSEGYSTTVAKTLQTQLEFNEALGVAVRLSDENLAQLTFARDAIGLSAEETNKLGEYTLTTGQNAQDIEKAMMGASLAVQSQYKVQTNMRAVMAQALKITGAIRANFKGNVAEIAAGITKAKLMGTTLEQLNNTASGLLDFETSIEAELEAELLTGKQLNLERARYYALTGDMIGLMEELNNQNVNFGEYTNMNVLAQESLAKVFNMTRGDFSDMLFQQEIIAKVKERYNLLDEKSALKEYERLKREGKLKEGLGNLLDEELSQRLGVLDAQTKFNNALDAAKEAFANLIAALGGPEGLNKIVNLIVNLVKMLQDVVASIQKSGFVKTFFGGGYTEEKTRRLKEEAIQTQTQMQELQVKFNAAQTAEAKAEVKKQMDEVASRSQQIQQEITQQEATSGQSYGEGMLKGAGAGVKGTVLTAKAGTSIAGAGLKGAGKIATKIGAEKVGAGLAAKGAGLASKGLAKRIPILGSLVSAGFAIKDLMEGDYAGFGLQLASGTAGLIDLVAPGVGTALSIGIDAVDAAREMGTFNSSEVAQATPETTPGTETVTPVATSTPTMTSPAIFPTEGYATGGFTGKGNPKDIAGVVHKGEYVSNAKETSLFSSIVSSLGQNISILSSLFTKQQEFTEKIEKNINSQQEFTTKTITVYNSFDRMVSLMETMLGPTRAEGQIKPMAPPIAGVGATSTNTVNNTTITTPGTPAATAETTRETLNIQSQMDKLVQSVNSLISEMQRPKDVTIENKIMLDYEALQVGFSKKSVQMNS